MCGHLSVPGPRGAPDSPASHGRLNGKVTNCSLPLQMPFPAVPGRQNRLGGEVGVGGDRAGAGVLKIPVSM